MRKNILQEFARSINIEVPNGRVQKLAASLAKLAEFTDKYAITNFASLSAKDICSFINKDLIKRVYTTLGGKSSGDVDVKEMVRSIRNNTMPKSA